MGGLVAIDFRRSKEGGRSTTNKPALVPLKSETMAVKRQTTATPTGMNPQSGRGRRVGKSKQTTETNTQDQQPQPKNKSDNHETRAHKKEEDLRLNNRTQIKHSSAASNLKVAPHENRDPTIKGQERKFHEEPLIVDQADKPSKYSEELDGALKEKNRIQEFKKMLENYPVEKLTLFMQLYGIDSLQDYVILSNDLFVKEIGSFYYCLICCKRFRIQDLCTIDQHLESKQHTESFTQLRSRLLQIPPKDISIHSAATDLLCDSWIERNRLTEFDREVRTLAISEFNNYLVEISPECSSRIIGSFLTGASCRNSDVNLELLHPNSSLFEVDPRSKDSIHHRLVDPDADYGSQINNHTLHYDLIGNAVESLYKIALGLLKEDSPFSVTSSLDDLLTKVPELVLVHLATKTTLRVCCYAESRYKLTCLIRNYLYLDERALQLCILVKHWAKICNIANPNQGTFSSDALTIIVIHFLQRTEPPVLPCLHSILKKKSQPKSKEDSSKSEDGLADKFNSLSLNPSICDNDQLVAADNIESEEMVEDNVDSDSHDKEILDDDEICSEFDMTSIESLNWSSDNLDSIRKLFIEFLRRSMDLLSSNTDVISIRTLGKVTLSSKRWNTQVTAVENPVSPKVNLSRTIGSMQTFDYIRECFAYGYHYLTSLPVPNQRLADPINYIKLYVNCRKIDFYFSMKEGQFKTNTKFDSIKEMIQQGLFSRDIETIRFFIEHFVINNKELDSIPQAVFKYYDTNHLIPPGYHTTMFCWFCKKYGHIKGSCPDRVIKDVVATNLDHVIDFDEGFTRLYTQDMISVDITRKYSHIMKQLTSIIQSGLNLDCSLTLFGSTVNLLGTFDSDLDICMTLSGNLTGRNVDCRGILTSVCKILQEVPSVRNMEPVLTARVPILRFSYGEFDIDLCMYNQCAIHNSRLIRTYVIIDFRLAHLYYLVKRYAKACDIADASKGSLSSYAWSLLVIHFMQNTSPPMLPVLQEPQNNKPKTMFGVSGWNVWFEDNVESVKPPYRSITLTALFKEFLLYYTRFNFYQRVVSIRTSQPLSKFQKNWNDCLIAIEDPFELTYNLSSRLDDQMATYIMNSFPNAYRRICDVQSRCQSANEIPPKLQTVKKLFVGSSIMDHPPPYRGCRICHKIGHRVVDCPLKRKSNLRSR